MDPFPIELNDKVKLVRLAPEHANELFRVVDANRTHLRSFLPWVDSTNSVKVIDEFIEKSLKMYSDCKALHALLLHEEDLVGIISHHHIDWGNKRCSIGYWLSEDHQGKGIMTEACRAFIRHAFTDYGLNRVEINTAIDNVKSQAIPRRLGFSEEGTQREAEWLYDYFVDHLCFALLKKDWKD